MFHAAIWGTVETVGLLIDSGGDGGIRDPSGLMPIAYASESVRGMLETEAGKARGTPILPKENKKIMLYWDDAPPPLMFHSLSSNGETAAPIERSVYSTKKKPFDSFAKKLEKT